MAIATVSFFKCLQNSHELGSNNEYMVSRLFFNLVTPNQTFTNLYSDIKQMAGSDYQRENIEVSLPHENVKQNIDYLDFCKAATDYYFSLIGSGGNAIRTAGCGSIIMQDNVFEMQKSYDVSILTKNAGW